MSDDERFVSRAAEVLNASMGELSPGITTRLNSIRESAVASVEVGLMNSLTLRSAIVGKPGDPLPVEVTTRLDDLRARVMMRAEHQVRKNGHGALAGWRERLSGGYFGVPVGTFASLCVLVTTLAIFNLPTSEEALPAALAEDVVLLASADDIELYENLEFYQWLAENGL